MLITKIVAVISIVLLTFVLLGTPEKDDDIRLSSTSTGRIKSFS